jgi:hypothetical protein
MPYCTPDDVRLRAVGMTEEVIPDVSSSSLNLTTCIAEAEAEVEEAGRAGDYEVPFDPAPDRIRDLTAAGALARARRGLQLGNQAAEEPDPYWQEFEAGLGLLREGQLDLGTVVVSGEAVVMPAEEGEWAQLSHRGLLTASVTVTNESGDFTYVEDRSEYEPGYRPDAVKDYQVDHREGRLLRLLGGRIGASQAVKASYEYYRRQPKRAEDAEYEGRTASADRVVRRDQQE